MYYPLIQFRRILIPCLVLFLVFYFAYHILHGQRGFFSYVHLKNDLATQEQELASLVDKRQRLEHRVALMHPDHPDPDMLDEQVRRTLGYAGAKDIVILRQDYAPQ